MARRVSAAGSIARPAGMLGAGVGTAIWEVDIISSKVGRDAKGAKYTYYNIALKTGLSSAPVHIVRRYRQFAALHQQLLDEAPTVLRELDVSFPKKKIFGRFEESFREERRVALQLFLRKVLSHEYLTTLPCVGRFFNANVNEHGRQTSNPHVSRDIPDLLLSDS